MKKLAYLAAAMALVLCIYRGSDANSKAPKSGIALTYANDKLMDGAGAQLVRIYGIYALSRYFHVPYVHTPLKDIGYQGLTALEQNAHSTSLQDRYNRIFTLPSDIQLPANAISVYVDVPTVQSIESFRAQAEKENKFYLLRILLPFQIDNSNPEIYRVIKKVSPFHAIPSHIFRIAIHVRRGEEYVVDSDRMLPNSYYVTATMEIVDALKQLGIPFVCELYTEVASRKFIVTPQHHGIEGRIPVPRLISPKWNRIEDFDVIPNLQKRINGDPIDALKGMTTADALIISRSTFSWLPALFGSGIVIYPPMGGAPLKEWLIADKNGNCSSDELLKQLQAWKRVPENASTATR